MIFALPVGLLLDRVSRVKVLSVMLVIWSVLTAFGALASTYWQLFVFRMGVGGGESASSPGAQSLVASLFPVKERASALGVVFSGLAIGTGISLAAGGYIAEHWGWRAVFLVAGVPGVLLACVMWLVLNEPPRSHLQEASSAQPASMLNVLAFVGRSPTVLLGTIGLSLATMSSASVWVWTIPILVRQHGMSLTEAGLIVGTAAGVVKLISTSGSGFLADWLAQGQIRRLWIVPSVALAFSFPVSIGLSLAPSGILVTTLVMVLGLTMGAHYSAPKSVIISAAPPTMRSSVAAFEELAVNLVGAAGPLLVGLISDAVGGADSAARALAATLSLNVVAALFLWLSARSVPRSTTAVPDTPLVEDAI
jgi:predicted MFS family arabinose efflux permease